MKRHNWKTRERHVPPFTLCLLSALFCVSVNAADNMLFHGTLIASVPCDISNGQDIAVEFGNVGVNKIDGHNYLKPIVYTLNCKTPVAGMDLIMKVSGTEAGGAFDNTVMQTSVAGLGLQLLYPGKPLPINSEIEVSHPDTPPQLSVVPVKDPKATLAAGEFNAVLTLSAQYQ